MSLIYYMTRIIWRLWFCVVIAIPILIMFPLLLLFTSRYRFYPYFYRLARFWAWIVLVGSGFYPKLTYRQRMEKGKSYMLIANHTSLIDIMLVLVSAKNPFVFVGKKELAAIPIFGIFYKRTCIMVDRNDHRSRSAVFERARKRLKSGTGICIFPEGGVPDQDVIMERFKDGAFRLAIEFQIAIIPVVLSDSKRKFPFSWKEGCPGILRAEIMPFISTEGLKHQDRAALRESVHSLMLGRLLSIQKK